MDDFDVVVGRIVHYRWPGIGCRPGIIVKVWSGTTVQLQVFMDADEEGKHNDSLHPMQWQTSRQRGGPSEEGHWHPTTECEVNDGL